MEATPIVANPLPSTFQLPVEGGSYPLDRDVLIVLPTTGPMRRKINVSGGRNIRVIGGEVRLDPGRAGGLQFYDFSGHVFLEGIKFDLALGGNQDCLKFGGHLSHAATTIVTVQNCICRGVGGTNRATGTQGNIQTIQTDSAGIATFELATQPDALFTDDVIFVGNSPQFAFNREWRLLSDVTIVNGVFRFTARVNRITDYGPPPSNTFATGGNHWKRLATVGLHGDWYQNGEDRLLGELRAHRIVAEVGYQGYILRRFLDGGNERGTRAVWISEHNMRFNLRYPHDDQSKLLFFGDADSNGANPANLLPLPYKVVDLWAEGRASKSPGFVQRIDQFTFPQAGDTRGSDDVALKSSDGWQTAFYGDDMGFEGRIKRGPRPAGDFVQWAPTGGLNVPGIGYISPGYHTDPNANYVEVF